jgi:hypothetical protein
MTAEPISLWEAIPELTAEQYHDLRMTSGGNLYQRCRTCGHCELAGGFCSWCTTGDYVVEAHVHRDRSKGERCPLSSRSVDPGAVKGTYHHVPGASTRRFPSDPSRRTK